MHTRTRRIGDQAGHRRFKKSIADGGKNDCNKEKSWKREKSHQSNQTHTQCGHENTDTRDRNITQDRYQSAHEIAFREKIDEPDNSQNYTDICRSPVENIAHKYREIALLHDQSDEKNDTDEKQYSECQGRQDVIELGERIDTRKSKISVTVFHGKTLRHGKISPTNVYETDAGCDKKWRRNTDLRGETTDHRTKHKTESCCGAEDTIIFCTLL